MTFTSSSRLQCEYKEEQYLIRKKNRKVKGQGHAILVGL